MRLAGIGVVMAALLTTSTAAMAQNPDPAVGRKIWVTMADASVHHGTVARVTSEALTLNLDGISAVLATRDVRRIEAPDRVSDGVRKGAIGLALAGGVGMGFLGGLYCSHNCAPVRLRAGLFGAGAGGAAGALIGGLLDAGNPGREVIFERTSVTIAPVLSGRARSVTVLFRW